MNVLIVVCGLPGSGKSFFAQALSNRIQAVYLNSDLLRKELFPIRRTYSIQEKSIVYETLLVRAEEELNNHSVIVDATFYTEELRKPFYRLAERVSSRLYVFYITADETIILERTSLARPDSEADYDVYLKVKELFEPFDRNVTTLVSERDNIEVLISSALTHIGYE